MQTVRLRHSHFHSSDPQLFYHSQLRETALPHRHTQPCVCRQSLNICPVIREISAEMADFSQFGWNLSRPVFEFTGAGNGPSAAEIDTAAWPGCAGRSGGLSAAYPSANPLGEADRRERRVATFDAGGWSLICLSWALSRTSRLLFFATKVFHTGAAPFIRQQRA